MTSDPVIFQSILIFGAFLAGIVQGATGFGSGIVLNAFWLHILEPSAAISLNIVSCLFVSALPIYKLRKTLDFTKLKSFVTVGETLKDITRKSKLSNHILPTHAEIVLKRMSFVPEGGNQKDIPAEYKPPQKFLNTYGRLHRKKPSNTIHTRFDVA